MTVVYVPAPTGDHALDTFRLQIALNSVPNAGGVVMAQADATYVISETLRIRNYVTFDLNGSTLRAGDGLNDVIIRSYHLNIGNQNIIIRNGAFDGNSANQSTDANRAHGVSFLNAHHCRIENCTFDDFRRDGVYIGGSGTLYSQVIGGACTGISLVNVTITNNHRNAVSITNANGFHFDNLNTEGNNRSVLAGAVDFEPNTDEDVVTNGILENSTITSADAPCIAIQRTQGLKSILTIRRSTLNQSGGYRAVTVFDSASGLTIEDNIIHCTSSGGVWMNEQSDPALDNVTIRRNEINGDDTADYAGIGLTGVSNALVSENAVSNFERGIWIASGCNIVAVTDNTLTSCATPIDVDGSATNVTQSGNEVVP